METKSVWPAAIVAMVLLVLCTGILFYKMPVVPDKITATVDNSALVASLTTLNQKVDALDTKVSAVNTVTTSEQNGSAISQILEAVTSEDKFKAEALDLATSEWEKKGYKAVFLFIDDLGLPCAIQEKEDIISVKVTDDSVRRVDVKDKDARVEQELTVRYDCIRLGVEETKRLYLVVDTTVKDGDVDVQEIELAP
jgi:hypothetical protein